MVVNAAVAATAGLTSMFTYNKNGVSSSLSKPAFTDSWNSNSKRDGHIQIVPIITLRQILSAIPSQVAIPYIKTDMQGYDFVAIAAAQDYMFERKVDYIYTEVYVHNQPTYQGVSNDFCTDWWPHMRRVGYDLVYLQLPSILSTKGLDTKAAKEFCAQPVPKTTELKLKEGNALWKRKGAADRDFAFQNS
jgi:FkbM family methyltransferase